jgi:hypothetical protein
MIVFAIAAGAGLGIAIVAGGVWAWEFLEAIRRRPEGPGRVLRGPRPTTRPDDAGTGTDPVEENVEARSEAGLLVTEQRASGPRIKPGHYTLTHSSE